MFILVHVMSCKLFKLNTICTLCIYNTHSWRSRRRRMAWRASFSWRPPVRVPMAFSSWSATKTSAWPARRRPLAGPGCAGCRRTWPAPCRASGRRPAGSARPPGGRRASTDIVCDQRSSFRLVRCTGGLYLPCGYSVLSVGRSVRLQLRVPVECLTKRFASRTTCVFVCVCVCVMCTPTDSIRRGPVSRSRMRFYIYIARRRRRIHPPLLWAGRDLNLVRDVQRRVSPAVAPCPRARTNYVTALTGTAAF